MQGVVMEIKENRCVVLKKDGTFAEIPNRNYTVGQTVTHSPQPMQSRGETAIMYL